MCVFTIGSPFVVDFICVQNFENVRSEIDMFTCKHLRYLFVSFIAGQDVRSTLLQRYVTVLTS